MRWRSGLFDIVQRPAAHRYMGVEANPVDFLMRTAIGNEISPLLVGVAIGMMLLTIGKDL